MMNVHEDTLQGLKEALDYVKGDNTKGRSMVVEVPDDEVEFYSKYRKLPEVTKKAIHVIMDEMLKASNQ